MYECTEHGYGGSVSIPLVLLSCQKLYFSCGVGGKVSWLNTWACPWTPGKSATGELSPCNMKLQFRKSGWVQCSVIGLWREESVPLNRPNGFDASSVHPFKSFHASDSDHPRLTLCVVFSNASPSTCLACPGTIRTLF